MAVNTLGQCQNSIHVYIYFQAVSREVEEVEHHPLHSSFSLSLSLREKYKGIVRSRACVCIGIHWRGEREREKRNRESHEAKKGSLD